MPNNPLITIPLKEDIEDRLKVALQTLVVNDRYLLDNNLHERTIVHKFSSYLQIVFPSWHVDVEYNRNIGIKKIIKDYRNDIHSNKKRAVFPDIIVHQRGTNTNLLVIEVKKSVNQNRDSIDFDCHKLHCYMKPDGGNNLGYTYGCYINFITKQPQEKTPYKYYLRDIDTIENLADCLCQSSQ